MNSQSIKSFSDIPTSVNRENTVTRLPANVFKATTKIYYQEKGYGFLYVEIPEGFKLNFDIVTSSKDQIPGAEYAKDDTLDRPVVIEAFVHGSVLLKDGYDYGLVEDQEVLVKLTQNETRKEKGIQVSSLPKLDGSTPRRANNEPRPFNKLLAFVDATVEIYFPSPDRKYGFVKISQDPKTGEPLPDGETRDAFFNEDALLRAGYTDGIEAGATIQVRYWTFSNGQSSVTQFRHLDRSNRTEPTTVAE